MLADRQNSVQNSVRPVERDILPREHLLHRQQQNLSLPPILKSFVKRLHKISMTVVLLLHPRGTNGHYK